MKLCYTCKTQLTDKNTYKKSGSRRSSSCKSCFDTYMKTRWINRKLEVITHFGNVCGDCKVSYPRQVYDLHHLDATQKDFDWRKMKTIGKDKFWSEVNKCVLLCSNCHRIRHIELDAYQ